MADPAAGPADARRRALQAVLVGLGALAAGAGATSALRGTHVVLGAGPASPSVDSEQRFYAAWYAAAGIALWSAVPDVERQGAVVRRYALTMVAAGVARLVGVRQGGRPHPFYLALAAAEIVLPPGLLLWHRSVAGGASAADVTSAPSPKDGP